MCKEENDSRASDGARDAWTCSLPVDGLCPARGCGECELERTRMDQVEGEAHHFLIGARSLQIDISGGLSGKYGIGQPGGKDQHRDAAGIRFFDNNLVALGAPFEQHGGAWAATLEFLKSLFVGEAGDSKSRITESLEKRDFKTASDVKDGLHPYTFQGNEELCS